MNRCQLLCSPLDARFKTFLFFTLRMGESNVFTCVCLSAGGRGYPRPGQRTPPSPHPLPSLPLSQDMDIPFPLYPLSLFLAMTGVLLSPHPPVPARAGIPLSHDQDGCAARAVCLLRSRRRTFLFLPEP